MTTSSRLRQLSLYATNSISASRRTTWKLLTRSRIHLLQVPQLRLHKHLTNSYCLFLASRATRWITAKSKNTERNTVLDWRRLNSIESKTLNRLRNSHQVNKTWSWNGRIYALLSSGRKIIVKPFQTIEQSLDNLWTTSGATVTCFTSCLCRYTVFLLVFLFICILCDEANVWFVFCADGTSMCLTVIDWLCYRNLHLLDIIHVTIISW